MYTRGGRAEKRGITMSLVHYLIGAVLGALLALIGFAIRRMLLPNPMKPTPCHCFEQNPDCWEPPHPLSDFFDKHDDSEWEEQLRVAYEKECAKYPERPSTFIIDIRVHEGRLFGRGIRHSHGPFVDLD